MLNKKFNYLFAFFMTFPLYFANATTVNDPNFVIDEIYKSKGMTAITFAKDGKMYVAEKFGKILYFEPNKSGGYHPPVVFADLSSEPDFTDKQESGLIGLALHPDYLNNRWIYAFYSAKREQRIIRLTANTTYNKGSGESKIILDGLPHVSNYHNGGHIQFNPSDQKLYIALGDDGKGTTEVQNLNSYKGKILRVDEHGKGLKDNPGYNGDINSIESRIWAIGHRNPWRFTFHPSTNVMYVSENGGPSDRVSQIISNDKQVPNGGWPDVSHFINPPDPKHKVILTPYSAITGIAIAHEGVFTDPNDPKSHVLYLANYTPSYIRRYKLSGPNLNQATLWKTNGSKDFISDIKNTAHIEFGPDGSLYICGTTQLENNETGHLLRRIRFVHGKPPIASFTTNPSPPKGKAPLLMKFKDTSTDDGEIVNWHWDFGDGSTSNQQNPSHTFSRIGTFNVSLTVKDNFGQENKTNSTVTINRTLALSISGKIMNALSTPSSPLSVPTYITLYQEDGTTPLPFSKGAGPNSNILVVDSGKRYAISSTILLQGKGIVISAGTKLSDRFKTVRKGMLIPSNVSKHTEVLDFHLSTTALAGQIVDTQGNFVKTDLGIAKITQGQQLSIAHGRDYLTHSGLPLTGVNHRIESDQLGYYYFSIPLSKENAKYFVDVVADTNSNTYVPSSFSESLIPGKLKIHNITVGLQSGGRECEDLSSIAEKPLVDYVTQIQPLWSSRCLGCHSNVNANASLNLAEEKSYSSIVKVKSVEVSGMNLVEPGSHTSSYLFEKINCNSPQIGNRMIVGNPLTLEEQALIRDWINQGALPATPSIKFFSATPTTIVADSGTSVTLSWSVVNSTKASLDGTGDVLLTGSQVVTPTETSTYNLHASDDNFTKSQSITVTVLPAITLPYGIDNVTPANGSLIEADSLTELVIHFNLPISQNEWTTGRIHLYKEGGDLIESIDPLTSHIKRPKTLIIPINKTLEPNSNYYIVTDTNWCLWPNGNTSGKGDAWRTEPIVQDAWTFSTK